MGRFVIKEKFWALGDDFHVYDTNKAPVYYVDGVVFSWGDDLSFQDLEGNELARITQTLLALMPTYEIHRDGKLLGELSKNLTWIKDEFELDVPGPNDYTIKGDFWQHEYNFMRGGRVVAQVSKGILEWTDTYTIDIEEGEDVVAVLCTVIVIDQVLQDESESS